MRPSLANAVRWMILCLAMAGAIRADDEDRDRAVMERFRAVLEKAPRRGTALDRVYGYHVERGSLDELLKTYRDRNQHDGLAPMLVGLIEAQRGKDSAAVAAFKVAEAKRPDDPLPSYYLGQSLVMVGEPTLAAEAFERALKRNPSRSDLLDIFQALGRVHQRARKDDLAMAAWTRLEAQFPDDPKVKELIASSLAEESKYEPALTRYEALAKTARDPYRKVQFRLESADLKVKLGRKAEALRDFEGLLGTLDPESWLGREVRRKVDDVFLRDDDQAGLSAYYEAWIKANPEDVEAMTRLARALASQGRSADSRTWLDRALKLAPSRKSLRLAMADQLAVERKFAEAADQYEVLTKAEPSNPDLVRDWGRMLLRDASRPEAERKRRASEVWRKLVDARPGDPSAAAQVAELYRQAGMADEAVELYRKAVGLAPGSPQYREYLGEYYHALKRPADALATWRGIADGPGRDSKNLRRLAEVLDGFGYKAEAVAAIADACALEPESFELRLKQADLLLGVRRFDEADAQLALAEPLADSEEARDDVLTRRIAGDEASGRLKGRLEAVREVASRPGADSLAWRRLARYAEAARQPAEAIAAAEKAVAIDPKSVASLATLATLQESAGRFLEAAESYRKLAGLDRRARAEHLTAVARLEAGLGRRDEAMAAGRDLLAASPGNPETLRFFADLCFQLGEREQGLETLRKAARGNSADVPALLNLADALAREFRTEEAIEQLWRAFDRSTEIDGKLAIVARLADLHLQRNQVDRLVGRLDRLAREEGHQREGALCLAQAYSSIGDLATARQQVEGLLATSPRDVGLLKQLSGIAEQEGELSLAVKYQKQLVDVAPGPEAAHRLVELALRSGEFDVAEAIWRRSAEGDGDLSRVLSALDNLILNGKAEAVLATTSRLLAKDPANWEVLYREGRALMLLDRRDEAKARFRAILDLRLDDDALSAITKARRKSTAPTSASTTASATALPERSGPRYRMSMATTIRAVFGLDPTVNVRSNTFFPADFGQGRIAALGGLTAIARREKAEAGWLASVRRQVEQAPGDVRRVRDDYYLSLVAGDRAQSYEKARAMVQVSGRDLMADYALLMGLYYRNVAPVVNRVNIEPQDVPAVPPDDLDLIRDAYISIARTRPAWLAAAIDAAVQDEMRKAGRAGELDGVYAELLAGLNDPNAYAAVAEMAAGRGDLDVLRKTAVLFDRLPASVRSNVMASQPYYISTPQGILPVPAYFMSQAMRVKADARAHGEILSLLDDEFARLRAPARLAERARATRLPSLTAARYAVYTSPSMALTAVDYPTANPYLGSEAIQLLRNAFALFQRDGMLANLKDHLRRAADASPTDVQARLALAAVLGWAAERDESVAEMARAVAIVPGDAELKLALAEVRAQRKEADEALALLDSIEATDQDVIKRRELLALGVAVQAGRADRAGVAAERLFGLRLDNPTQLQLASRMRQLGMNEMADAVLARARRRSGNDVDALVGLMATYRRQGDVETASQVALQVLRKAPTRMQPGQSATDLDDPNHAQAIQVLAGSGKLKEQIERVEAQLKLSPGSVPLHQALVNYYRASNQSAKLRDEYQAILRLRPDDIRLRLQVAGQLVRIGPEHYPAAIEEYRTILAKDPAYFGGYWNEISTAFLGAGRFDELLALVDEVGLKSTGNFGPVANLISSLLKEPTTSDKGLTLLARAWEAFPAEREFLLTPVLGDDSFWARPGAYRYARESLIPAAETARMDPWSGLDNQVLSTNPAGKLVTAAARLLDLASRDAKLDELASELDAAIKRWPRWQSGRTMLGLVRLRQGRVDEGNSILDAQLAGTGIRPSYAAIMLVGQETRDNPALASIARRIYREAIKPDVARPALGWGQTASQGFVGSAVQNLIILEHKAGNDAEARALLREATARNASPVTSVTASANTEAFTRLVGLVAIGETARSIGETVSAFRAFHEALAATETQQMAKAMVARPGQPAGSVAVDTVLGQARDGVDATLKGLDRDSAAAVLRSLVPTDGKGTVDLALVAHPREADRAAVVSLFAAAVAAAEPSSLAAIKADLAARGDDIKASTALTLASREPEEFPRAVARLESLLEARPLDPIPPGKRATARQQAEASDRLGLWLVARECGKQDATRPAGDRFSARAIEAAGRQAEPTLVLAMLRESGQAALDRGDRDGASSRWSAMLDAILGVPTASPSRVPALTLDRFRQAASLSRLSADAGLTDLSLRSIRESLKGGPPVGPLTPARVTASTLVGPVVVTPSRAGSATLDAPADPSAREVEAALLALDIAWTRREVPAAAIYEVLREVVLPPSRPNDFFSYGPGANEVLVRRGAEAGQLDDLRDRLAKRQAQPASRLAARQLMAEIEQARGRQK